MSTMSRKTTKYDGYELEDFGRNVSQRPGDLVKLSFSTPPGCPAVGESMWVRVTKRIDTHEYEGKLENQPAFVPLEWGDKVRFKSRNIGRTVPGGLSQEAEWLWQDMDFIALRLHCIIEAIEKGEPERAKVVAAQAFLDIGNRRKALEQDLRKRPAAKAK